jgi:ABC-type phosphate transport system substrate-binding protein
MIKRIFLSLIVLLLGLGVQARAELVLIVHPANPVEQLTREQVVDIYMGRNINFPGGNAALPIDLSPDSPLRAAFYQSLVGKTVSQVNAFWARLLFTGRATPPHVLPDIQTVLKTVAENRDAVGYIDDINLDNTVKIVFRVH